jgi:hypothetical protein
MTVRYNPRVVADGLLMYLDAANPKSYSGSGTVWNDLSGRGNNGTLVNMDATNYNRANAGRFSFDGINERISCGNPASLQITVGTISAWVNATNTNSGWNGIISKQQAWALFVADNVLITYDWSVGSNRTTGITIGNGTWNHVALTFTETVGTPSNNAIVYLNGIAVLTTTVKHANHTVEVQIGDANASQYLTGYIAQASIYNRVLTAAEVSQNFNALRGRFGI